MQSGKVSRLQWRLIRPRRRLCRMQTYGSVFRGLFVGYCCHAPFRFLTVSDAAGACAVHVRQGHGQREEREQGDHCTQLLGRRHSTRNLIIWPRRKSFFKNNPSLQHGLFAGKPASNKSRRADTFFWVCCRVPWPQPKAGSVSSGTSLLAASAMSRCCTANPPGVSVTKRRCFKRGGQDSVDI